MSYYFVQSGDSPQKIAKQFGVTVPALLGANPQKRIKLVANQYTWTSLIGGEQIMIPGVPSPGIPQTPPPVSATVATHDQPPAGDLTVHAKPYGKVIGGVDKNGTVQVLDWNADGGNAWAKISWGGGRNSAVTGYANRKYLAAGVTGQPAPAPAVQNAAYNASNDTVSYPKVGTSDDPNASDPSVQPRVRDFTGASVSGSVAHDLWRLLQKIEQSSQFDPATKTFTMTGDMARYLWEALQRVREKAQFDPAANRLAIGMGDGTSATDTQIAADRLALLQAQTLALLQKDGPYGDNLPAADPTTASVATHDKPPAGDLTIHVSPHGRVIGAADKDGVVTILDWNADGKHEWAKISWAGGRHRAVTGFANRKYLAAHSQTGVGDAITDATTAANLIAAGVSPVAAAAGAIDAYGIPAIASGITAAGNYLNPAAPVTPDPGASMNTPSFNPSGDPLTATVTTHDPAPAGDLTVHITPDATVASKIGAVDKGGVVQVLNWNGDGANKFAMVQWTGGRNPAVTGFANRKYLTPGAAAPGANPPADVVPAPQIAQIQNQEQPAPQPQQTPVNQWSAPGATPGIATQPGQEPATATITTHDQPPSGDLRVHASPSQNGTTLGSADKGGTVNISKWNADGNNLWAYGSWSGSARNPTPATGYMNRKYLAGGAPGSASQPAIQPIAQPTTPTTPASPSDNNTPGNLVKAPEKGEGLSQGAIVGIALGVAALIGVVGYAAAKGPARAGATRIVTRYRKKPVHHRKPTKKKGKR